MRLIACAVFFVILPLANDAISLFAQYAADVQSCHETFLVDAK